MIISVNFNQQIRIQQAKIHRTIHTRAAKKLNLSDTFIIPSYIKINFILC